MCREKIINKKYSAEFKLSVILDMQEHKLCYHEVIRKFWGENVYEQNYIKQVQRWERKYLEEGYEGLMKKLHEYIYYYNNERISLKLKMSPVKYRTQFQYI